jgi:YbbR domain-containing protein
MIGLLQRYFFHNFGLKFLSLLIATGLWFIISRDEQPAEVAVRAPIVFKNSPANLVISSDAIPETQILVRGPERIVRQLTSNEVQAEIDLSDTAPEERTFELTPRQVRHPRDIQVKQIVPGQLRLAFDTRLSREVEIRPNVLSGNFPDGEEVVKVETDPSHIAITGPRQHVERIAAATTDPIDPTGIRGSAVFTTSVYVSDPLVQVEQVTSVRVTVTVQKLGSATAH